MLLNVVDVDVVKCCWNVVLNVVLNVVDVDVVKCCC